MRVFPVSELALLTRGEAAHPAGSPALDRAALEPPTGARASLQWVSSLFREAGCFWGGHKTGSGACEPWPLTTLLCSKVK